MSLALFRVIAIMLGRLGMSTGEAIAAFEGQLEMFIETIFSSQTINGNGLASTLFATHILQAIGATFMPLFDDENLCKV
jgi:hypothetical protein